MAKDKKYYWLKLKEDFFRQKEIKKLRRIAGGDTYTIIYLKMQLLSLKNEGFLFYEGTEESFEEQIALEIDEDIDNVKVTILFLIKNNLIENANNDFFLNKASECIGKEGKSAERVRKYREKQKEIKENNLKVLQSNNEVTKCNTEIEIENRDKDIEIRDKEIETTTIEVEKICSGSGDEINFEDLKEYLLKNEFARATDQNIKAIIKQFPSWWIKDAIEVSIFNSNLNLAYVYGILRNWNDDGKTKDITQGRQINNNEKKVDSFNNFEHRKYNYSELEKDLLGWNE